MKEESFEEWLEDNGYQDEFLKFEREVWEYQKNKYEKQLQETKALLKECRENGTLFYGSKYNWDRFVQDYPSGHMKIGGRTEWQVRIKTTDYHLGWVAEKNVEKVYFGGKRAREFEAKNKARLDEIFGGVE